MAGIALVTERNAQDLTVSDSLLATALNEMGHRVVTLSWGSLPLPPEGTTAAVIRSPWDYHHAPEDYVAWLEALEASGVQVLNSLNLIRWNINKIRYLRDLERKGVPLLSWCVVRPSKASITDGFELIGCEEAVLKPSIGASGSGVLQIRKSQVNEVSENLLLSARSLIMQEFAPEFQSGGELCGVFFSGKFSHGIRRTPKPGEFRVNRSFGGLSQPDAVSGLTLDTMRHALSALAETPVYARVDGIERKGRFYVSEVEVNEPALWLDTSRGSALAKARAVSEAISRT